MDVSPPTGAGANFHDYHEICCDACGYPRIGLPSEARCPECGEPPPKFAGTLGAGQAMTHGTQAWLRCICAGLVLLVISYLFALRVILVMPISSQMLPALNVPAPKIAATALVQRTVGNKPGPWGVAGTVAVFCSIAALWLLTAPRHSTGDDGFSVRALTRWVGVLSCGAVFGTFLSLMGSYYTYAEHLVPVAVLMCELPANGLLYFYLYRISRQLNDKRAGRLLIYCAWAIPVAAGVGVLATFLADADASFPMAWQIVRAAYGAAIIATGIIAFAGVGRLTITAINVAFSQWKRQGRRALLRTPALLIRLIDGLAHNSHRWCIVAGVALWVLLMPAVLSQMAWYSTRSGPGGDVPYVNFVGPKVAIAPAAFGYSTSFDYRYATYLSSAGYLVIFFFQLIAVWLITRPPDRPHPDSWQRVLVRWTATIGIGASIGWSVQRWQVPQPASYTAAAIILFLEVPATGLIYWHLSQVAQRYGIGRLVVPLRRLSLVTMIMILMPLTFLAGSLIRVWRGSMMPTFAAAVVMAVELAIGLIAAGTLIQLAWALATERQTRRVKLSSTADDPALAHSAAQ